MSQSKAKPEVAAETAKTEMAASQSAPPAPEVAAETAKTVARRPPREWASLLGHIPRRGPVPSGGKAHKGPVFEHFSQGQIRKGPIAQHMFHGVPVEQRWYENSQITEAEYLAGVELAMGVRVSMSHPAPAQPAQKEG
jgi:hypothetical protein